MIKLRNNIKKLIKHQTKWKHCPESQSKIRISKRGQLKKRKLKSYDQKGCFKGLIAK